MKSFVFSITISYCLMSHSIECPPGHFVVLGHPRNGFSRSDGTVVRPTTVITYCKELTHAYEYLQKRFKKGVPKNWPHQVEKTRLWTESEKEKII